MKRREFLGLSAAAIAISFPAVLRAQDKRFAGVTLSINGYGGDWDRLMQEHIVAPLERKTGLKVTFTPGTSPAAMAKVMAAPDDPAFDILMLDSPVMPELLRTQAGRPVTTSDVKSLANALPVAREFGDYGVPLGMPSIVLAYNTSKVATAPKSFAELARPDLKDRVGLFNIENTVGLMHLMAVAEANGGGIDNIAPGFAALAKVKPNVATITSSTVNMLQLLEQDEVWAAPFFDGRVISLQKAGKPIGMLEPAEGTYSVVSYLNPVKTSRKTEAIDAFLEEALSGDYPAALASFFGYRPGVEVKMPTEVAQRMLKPEHQKSVDWSKVAANRAAWLSQFNKEFR